MSLLTPKAISGIKQIFPILTLIEQEEATPNLIPTPAPNLVPTPAPNSGLVPTPAPTDEQTGGGEKETVSITSWAIWAIVGLLAAYLSWSCNTTLEVPMASKVIEAIIAFCCGWCYLIYYVVFRDDICNMSLLLKKVLEKGGLKEGKSSSFSSSSSSDYK